MPSPALQKLETLPMTPLQGSPTASPGSSKPSSRRGSSTVNAGPASSSASTSGPFRRASQSNAGTAVPRPLSTVTSGSSQPTAPTSSGNSNNTNTNAPSYFTTPNTSASLAARTALRNHSINKPAQTSELATSTGAPSTISSRASTSAALHDLQSDTNDSVEATTAVKLAAAEAQAADEDARNRKTSQDAIQEAVSEEQMLPARAPRQVSADVTTSAAQVHADSALDDESESEDDADEGQEAEPLRTGNERLRQGSRRLSRMSSTLGEGVTAHWKRSTPASPLSVPTDGASNSKKMTRQPGQATSTAATQLAPQATTSAPISIPDLSVGSPMKPSEPQPASLPERVQLQAAQYSKDREPSPKAKLSPIEQAKRSAAYRAVDCHVKPHHKVIGIGSGSTVPYVVDRLLEQGEEANRRRWFVPTGFQSKELIVNAGLKLGDVDQFPYINVTIDGADDVDYALNAIKGGGACHLREKVLAEAAEEFVIVADYRKNNNLLGQSWKQGIPIETPPFAYSKVLDNLERIPGCLGATLRMAKAKAGPVVTDNSNFVIDAPFDEAHMREPEQLLMKLKMLTGVVEVGLFCGMARCAYFGNQDGSVTARWSDGQSETLKDGEEAKITADMVDEDFRPTEYLLTVDLHDEEAAEEAEGQAATDQKSLEMGKLKAKLEMLKMTST